jgi:hypothetical protein
VRSTSGAWNYTIAAYTNSSFPTLTLGTEQAGSLQGTYDIKYYQVLVTAGEHLFVVLDSAGNIYASELYIKFGGLPTTVDYDDKGVSPNADQAVEIASTQAGYYYIMVRSTSGAWNYTIAAYTHRIFLPMVLRN